MFEEYKVPEYLSDHRLDQILLKLNIVDSRNKANGIIMSGYVFIDDKKIEKAGKIIKANSILKIKKRETTLVSRGVIKLNDALHKFKINVTNKVCLDIGCSTGGFSEVLLQKNAKQIFSVDVGYGQFDWNLRKSNKISLFERLNIKNLTKDHIPVLIDIVVCDVSFISVKKFFLHVKKFLNKKFIIISLIKPQFESKRKDVGRGGIIKDSNVHKYVCEDIKTWFSENFVGVSLKIIESPILGQKGNKEFFIYVKN